jgi:hypothetical protein
MPDPVAALNAALAGRYEIERQIGQGGMATVYLAEDLKHHRKVALKVLKPELAAIIGADRFLAEIETTAGLQHPNILPLHDSGEADKLLFYVMPHVEGESQRRTRSPASSGMSRTRRAPSLAPCGRGWGVTESHRPGRVSLDAITTIGLADHAQAKGCTSSQSRENDTARILCARG